MFVKQGSYWENGLMLNLEYCLMGNGGFNYYKFAWGKYKFINGEFVKQ